jgi:hypothetical protein
MQSSPSPAASLSETARFARFVVTGDRHGRAGLPGGGAGRAPAPLRVLPHPSVDVLGRVAGVPAHHPDRQGVTRGVRPILR